MVQFGGTCAAESRDSLRPSPHNLKMPAQQSSVRRVPSAREKIGWYVGISFWTLLAAYWSVQMALGVPDAYRGQHRGGLLLSVASLIMCATNLTSSTRWRHVLILAMLVPLVSALYVIGLFGG